MTYDKMLIDIFVSSTGRLKKSRINKISCHPNIKEYLDNRFDDKSSGYKEILDRIKFGIEKRPSCEYCGGFVRYKGLIGGLPYYRQYCSCKCAQSSEDTKSKYKSTCTSKYGVSNVLYLDDIQEKRKQTLMKHYGVDVPAKSDEVKNKMKETCMSKYSTQYSLQNKDVREKIKDTCKKRYGSEHILGSEYLKNIIKERYGVDFVTQIPDVKEKIKLGTSSLKCKDKKERTCLDKYGVTHVSMLESVKDKKISTRRRNHTFNTSKPEEELYLHIKSKFSSVERQYKDKDRYPFNCDFYIPELDYFIEYNGFASHGGHPYSSESKDDNAKLNIWNSKYENGKHPMYANMIKVWTIKDPEKRKCAKEHNLNFKEIWSLQEGKEFIDSL